MSLQTLELLLSQKQSNFTLKFPFNIWKLTSDRSLSLSLQLLHHSLTMKWLCSEPFLHLDQISPSIFLRMLMWECEWAASPAASQPLPENTAVLINILNCSVFKSGHFLRPSTLKDFHRKHHDVLPQCFSLWTVCSPRLNLPAAVTSERDDCVSLLFASDSLSVWNIDHLR